VPGDERVAAHVFVADVAVPVLDEADRHHLERVLRLRPGETVTVGDGAGAVRRCVFATGGALEPTGAVEVTPRPAPELTVGFALVKGDRPEWIVQKLTECGIDRIVPFVAARSVVRWEGDKAAKAVERLRRVSREAAMQSRQAHLPVVAEVTALADLVGAPGGPPAFADAGGEPPSLAHPWVVVGPEGGWSEEERAMAATRVGFGPAILRAETAALAAGVLLTALRAKIVDAVHRHEARSP
jgi:16S rRNA (uracil1498-N3)-methyltransferase